MILVDEQMSSLATWVVLSSTHLQRLAHAAINSRHSLGGWENKDLCSEQRPF